MQETAMSSKPSASNSFCMLWSGQSHLSYLSQCTAESTVIANPGKETGGMGGGGEGGGGGAYINTWMAEFRAQQKYASPEGPNRTTAHLWRIKQGFEGRRTKTWGSGILIGCRPRTRTLTTSRRTELVS